MTRMIMGKKHLSRDENHQTDDQGDRESRVAMPPEARDGSERTGDHRDAEEKPVHSGIREKPKPKRRKEAEGNA